MWQFTDDCIFITTLPLSGEVYVPSSGRLCDCFDQQKTVEVMPCQLLGPSLEKEGGNFYFLSPGTFSLGALSCHTGKAKVGTLVISLSQAQPSRHPFLGMRSMS